MERKSVLVIDNVPSRRDKKKKEIKRKITAIFLPSNQYHRVKIWTNMSLKQLRIKYWHSVFQAFTEVTGKGEKM